MKNKLLEIIDFEKVNILLEGFNKSTGFVTAILDLEGNVLSKSGWRTICTEFHRVHPETAAKCRISDTELASQLAAGEKYHFYKCLNGLVDVAVPIVIKGEHIANLFSGQFFFEKPKRELFNQQAEKYNFDITKYIDALENIPVVSEEKVKNAMQFLLNMTQLISEMTLQKLEQYEYNQALAKSEERFRTIINQAGDAMYLCNFDGEIKMTNTHSVEMLGYSQSEFLKMKVGDLDVNYFDPKLQKELWGKLEKEKPQTLLTTHKRKDGSHVPVEIRHSLIDFEGYKGILGFVRDITERKKAEDLLKRSESRFRKMFNNATFGILICQLIKDENGKNIDYVFLQANNSIFNHLGIYAKDIIGKRASDIIPVEETTYFIEKFAEVVKTGKPYEYTKYYPSFDRTVDNRSFYLEDDFFAVIFFDISEKIRAEKSLAAQSKMLTESQQMAHIGSFRWKFETGELSWTDETYRLFGLPVGSTIPSAEALLKTVYSEDQLSHQNWMQACMAGKNMAPFAYRVILPDGEIKWHLISGGIEYGTDGSPVALVGTNQDITKSKLAEEEIKKLNVELEQKVKNRTLELEKKYLELERVNKLFVDRELRMIELKQKIKELEKK